jgi:hypothetical protein
LHLPAADPVHWCDRADTRLLRSRATRWPGATIASGTGTAATLTGTRAVGDQHDRLGDRHQEAARATHVVLAFAPWHRRTEACVPAIGTNDPSIAAAGSRTCTARSRIRTGGPRTGTAVPRTRTTRSLTCTSGAWIYTLPVVGCGTTRTRIATIAPRIATSVLGIAANGVSRDLHSSPRCDSRHGRLRAPCWRTRRDRREGATVLGRGGLSGEAQRALA